MTLAAVLLVVGLVVLAVGADQLVVGASRLALARGISPIVIGALVIGFGTSAPELLVSGLAAADGDVDLGVGNIIGSNVANLSLVLGLAALVGVLAAGGRYIRVANHTLWREGVISLGAVLLFWVLVQDGFERWEGVVLLVAFAVAMTIIMLRSHASLAARAVPVHKPIVQSVELFRTALGLAATIAGAQLAVIGAVDIAEKVGWGSGFVGLSLVAFGTSLPELITGVQAARRGETDLMVGNILGSNTFNSLLVSAVVALVGPGPLLDSNLSGLAVWIMVGVSVGAWVLMYEGEGLQRWWEGALLLAVYLVSLPFLISDHNQEVAFAASVPSASVSASSTVASATVASGLTPIFLSVGDAADAVTGFP
ncbi:MAG: sodium:calcium antiporter [Acidimicrobiia bacterium]|nr:sodium:calcium antiporter [Acidimicrobiia bacterium]